MQELEEHLEYKFKNASLLKGALTHPSVLTSGEGNDFERLEFLGDRVLGLVIATWLFKKFPQEKEGDMACRFISLVRKETLVKVAYSIGLDRVMVAKKEKSFSEKKRLETMLADGCEALIGALYLEGGLETADSFIQLHWKDLFQSDHPPPRDPKSLLQEWVQGQGKSHPQYSIHTSSGPAHAPYFIAEVRVEGFEPVRGEGSSKRLAEKNAAQRLLDVISSYA